MSAKQLLPMSGVISVLLIIVSFIVGGETPEADASLQEVVSYYSDHDTDLQLAAALLGLGAFFFILFTATIATLLRSAQGEGRPSATVSLAGGIVFTVGLAIFAGLTFTAADVVDDIAPTGVQTLNALCVDMFFPVAVGGGAFLLGTGVGLLKTDALPTWLSWAAIVIGVVAISPIGFFGFLALGVWTLITSVLLSMRASASPGGPDEQRA
ncbi:MAG TPA: hypothetical protein VIE64_06790 [Solirubrobacterales bacterium]